MPYTIIYRMDLDEGFDAENFVERNKDEVIDRLVWLLRRLEMHCSVEYPDGEAY
mgnify:CR=1 FL=1